jgi:hypothetical protein
MRLMSVKVVSVVAALTTAVLASCTGQPQQPKPETASDVISSLGAVPIPSASAGTPAPVTASVGHPQLVAMGAPVQVSLPGNVQALVTTSGPASDTPSGGAKPNAAVTGTITVTVRPSAGTVRLAAGDLSCRDESGAAVALTPVGPATVSVGSGQTATVTVTGSFQSGGAQINWQQDGHVIAIWDFTVEND